MTEQSGIYIGTSGWSYPKGEGTWKGYFYPAGKINELEYYSQFFNTVELNSSFYRPPNPEYAKNWAKRTPDGFLFTVKLWQKFTHPQMYKDATGREAAISQDDVDLFNRSIAPLADSGKMGALLAQFPPSFKSDPFGQQILDAVIRTFGEYRIAVELRHRSWTDNPQTAEILKAGNACWVEIDEPKFSTSIAAEVPLTSDMAYFRFHGRNRENWWKGNSETRYKYLYSEDELAGLAGKMKEVAANVSLMFAQFNNHWQGYAPRNATDLKKQMKLPFVELPMMKEPEEGTQKLL
ncbi:MAG: DUF72 domain-containing protein [Dehalococcoidales bacterium]|nr:DUF72 domain-containing protein [Dehalococcoidales bacterium]